MKINWTKKTNITFKNKMKGCKHMIKVSTGTSVENKNTEH